MYGEKNIKCNFCFYIVEKNHGYTTPSSYKFELNAKGFNEILNKFNYLLEVEKLSEKI